jgi:3',5'-nucleoside bisphosphate phosphatase
MFTRSRTSPLLCELHAHSTWSDGELGLGELVDLCGLAGLDVLCVTDHVLRSDDPWRPQSSCVHEETFAEYVAAVDREAERARALYGMLVVPGLELTHNHPDSNLSAHAVAVGLREFVSPDLGLVGALLAARAAGAAVVAAHPHEGQGVSTRPRSTRRFWREWDSLAPLLHRVELMNGRDLYGWVVEGGVPLVASGDVHRRTDVTSWKTLVPCAADEEELVAYLRTSLPAYLLPFRPVAAEQPAAA